MESLYFAVKSKVTDAILGEFFIQHHANAFAQDYADKNGVSVYIDTIIHMPKDFRKKKRVNKESLTTNVR